MKRCYSQASRVLLLCLSLISAGCGALRQQSAQLPDPLQISLAQAGIPSTAIALDVRTVDGERLVAHNAMQAFKPASIIKLLTTAAALELLGPDYRWITRVHTNGSLKGDVLLGDLYIEGGGDPRFAHENLTRLLRRLRALGVREIQGNLVLDRSLFERSDENPGSFDASPDRAYNALPDALLLDAKALTVRLAPDRETGQVQMFVEPPMLGFSVEPLLMSDQACNHWREQLKPVLSAKSLRFEGNFPASCGERFLTLHVHTLSSVQYFDAVFRQLWSEVGGVFKGQALEGRVPVNAHELLTGESITLAELIRDVNKYSNNVMARQLLLSLAMQRGGNAATAVAGSARALDWLARSGVDASSVVIENGSGLSRNERISADALSNILQKEWHSSLMPEFIASLPLAGIDGTMRKRVQASTVKGHAHIKTGSLADVASIAGYLEAKSGRRIIVTCMINHANASAARASFDQLLEWIYGRY